VKSGFTAFSFLKTARGKAQIQESGVVRRAEYVNQVKDIIL
jgi:hypothetical protein